MSSARSRREGWFHEDIRRRGMMKIVPGAGVLALLVMAASTHAGRVDWQSESGIIAYASGAYLDRAGNLWQIHDGGGSGWDWYPRDVPGGGEWPVPISEIEWWGFWSLVTRDGGGWAANEDEWFFVGNLPGSPVGVIHASERSPDAMARPNPFAQSTILEFETSHALNDARVELYSVDGRRVHEIVIGDVEIEQFSIAWDGRDGNGLQLEPGVYLATLSSRGGVEMTIKITYSP